ncbi:hypothetical protein ACK1MO_004588 [Salmonella enterica]
MKNEFILMRLVARGLLDIRVAASSGNVKACLVLSDFIHNLPYSIEQIVKGNMSYQNVMEDLKDRARVKNMEGWLANALRDINSAK